MSKTYNVGTTVKWNWGNGTATGKVEKSYTQKITRKIDGSEITRDADDENPAYYIKQEDGSDVLKSHSELNKA